MSGKVCNQWNCKHTDCENHMSQLDRFDIPIQPVDFREIGLCEQENSNEKHDV